MASGQPAIDQHLADKPGSPGNQDRITHTITPAAGWRRFWLNGSELADAKLHQAVFTRFNFCQQAIYLRQNFFHVELRGFYLGFLVLRFSSEVYTSELLYRDIL